MVSCIYVTCMVCSRCSGSGAPVAGQCYIAHIVAALQFQQPISSNQAPPLTRPQALRDEKDEVEADINRLAAAAAKDLGLVLDKTLKLEWHKAANSRTRCLRITQKEEKVVRSKLHAR